LTHPNPTVESAVFTPNSRAVVTAYVDGWARWWDTDTGRPLGSSLRHDGGVYGAAFDAAGKQVATYSADTTVRIWDVSSASLPGFEPVPTAGRAVISGDGSRALVAGNNFVRVLNTTTSEQVGARLEASRGPTTPLAISANGRRLASVDRNGVLRIRENSEPLIETDLKQSAHGLTFDARGNRLAVVADGGIVQIWDMTSRTQTRTLRRNCIAWMATFDSSGQWLAVASSNTPTARLWDLTGLEPSALDLPTPDGIGMILIRPDGRALVTQFHRTSRLWDINSRTPIGPVIDPFDATYYMTFSPDGMLLVSRCGRQVRLWNGKTGKPRGGRALHHAADAMAERLRKQAGTW
jgi:WD40 repeat protein